MRDHKPLELKIADILMNKWDPIGISNVPEAKGEYDSYVNEIVSLLDQGAGLEDVISQLHQIESEMMGLPSVPRIYARSAAIQIVSEWNFRKNQPNL